MTYRGELKDTEAGFIPIEWESDKLKNHLIIKGRIGWKGLKVSEYTKHGPLIVGGLQIKQGTVVWKECAHVTRERYEESAEIKLHESDILMTKDGTIGKLAYIREIPYESTVASHIHVIRSKSEKVHPRFLIYFFKSPVFQSLIRSKISGSVVPALTQKDINDTYFTIPPLFEQKAIAKILSDLDDKIELNQQMNQTLEQIAQTIFRRWFIDYEFPDENGEPYKSSGGVMVASELGEIPKGWEIKELKQVSQVIDCLHSKKPVQKSKGKLLLQVFNIGTYGKIELTEKYYIQNNDYSEWTKRIEIMSNDLIVSKTGRVGAIAYIPHFIKAAIGRNLVGIRSSSNVHPLWLREVLLSECMRKEIDLKTNTGTILKSLHVKEIEKLRLVFPQSNVELIDKFGKVIKPTIDQIQIKIQQNSILTNLRDSLLPRLMSGKIRVPTK